MTSQKNCRDIINALTVILSNRVNSEDSQPIRSKIHPQVEAQ